MNMLEGWSDALVTEGLREAADTFFSARKSLEAKITALESRIAAMRTQAKEIEASFAGLNCLLGSEIASRELFAHLGIEFADKSLHALQECYLTFPRPYSFTRQGLYIKIVWERYASLARMMEIYMHGSTYSDPAQPHRVLITSNYDQVYSRCTAINQHIHALNESNRPSEALGFAKRMDPALMHRESLMGGGGEIWRLDQDLAFTPLIFENYNLPIFPDLPVNRKARTRLEQWCARMFKKERISLESLLTEMLGSENSAICVLRRSAPSDL